MIDWLNRASIEPRCLICAPFVIVTGSWVIEHWPIRFTEEAVPINTKVFSMPINEANHAAGFIKNGWTARVVPGEAHQSRNFRQQDCPCGVSNGSKPFASHARK